MQTQLTLIHIFTIATVGDKALGAVTPLLPLAFCHIVLKAHLALLFLSTLGASLGHVWVAKVVLLALTLGSQLILYTFSVTSAWRYIGLHLAFVALAHHGAVAVTNLGSWLHVDTIIQLTSTSLFAYTRSSTQHKSWGTDTSKLIVSDSVLSLLHYRVRPATCGLLGQYTVGEDLVRVAQSMAVVGLNKAPDQDGVSTLPDLLAGQVVTRIAIFFTQSIHALFLSVVASGG